MSAKSSFRRPVSVSAALASQPLWFWLAWLLIPLHQQAPASWLLLTTHMAAGTHHSHFPLQSISPPTNTNWPLLKRAFQADTARPKQGSANNH